MATKMNVRCCTCSEEFPIYYVEVERKEICCPNCGAVLSKDFSDSAIDLFQRYHELNVEILKSHGESKSPLFEINFSHNTYLHRD